MARRKRPSGGGGLAQFGSLLDFAPGDPTGGVGLDAGGDVGVTGGAPPVDTSTLSDADLAAMAGTGLGGGDAGAGMGGPADLGAAGTAGVGLDTVDPDQAEVEQLNQALSDPNLDPATRMELQQRLALAARRRLAGVGGVGGAGGGGLAGAM